MTLPVKPPITPPIDWAATPVYPATPSEKAWEGSPTKVAPALNYFTGEEPVLAETTNYVLRSTVTSIVSLVAPIDALYMQAQKQEASVWAGAALNWPASATGTATPRRPCWSESHKSWALPYQDTNTAPGKVRLASLAGEGGIVHTTPGFICAGVSHASSPSGSLISVYTSGGNLRVLHTAPYETGTDTDSVLASSVLGVGTAHTATCFFSPAINRFVILACYVTVGGQITKLFTVTESTGSVADVTPAWGAVVNSATTPITAHYTDTMTHCVIALRANISLSLVLRISAGGAVTIHFAAYQGSVALDHISPIGLVFRGGALYMYGATLNPAAAAFRIQRATSSDGGITWVFGTVNTATQRQQLFGAIGQTFVLIGEKPGAFPLASVASSEDLGLTWQALPQAGGFEISAHIMTYAPEHGGMFCVAGALGFVCSLPVSTDPVEYTLTP